MHLVPVSIESVRIGQPLPFPLMDKAGVLLAKKSFIIGSRQDLQEMAERGNGLYIDVADSEAHHRAYIGQLHNLVREEKAIGQIANTQIDGSVLAGRAGVIAERTDWLDLQVQANTLLRDHMSPFFRERLERIHGLLNRESLRNSDGALFALVYLSSTETHMYSATHSMLVSLMCGLAAREVLNWPPEIESALCKAALTMNLGMTDLQDRLAGQREPPNAQQRAGIDRHAERSVTMLSEVGVADTLWLDAIKDHHTEAPGPLRAKTPAQRLARLIQRADMFAARLAPRASRVPISPAAAMQACYFDENRQVDDAGAALIKAVGIYQPGSFVKLANDEVAVVVRRGKNTTTPRVAVLVNRNGIPTVEPTLRDTSSPDFKIVASVAHREVKVKINLERLLPLTVTTGADRPW